jgi:hypothetical protein
MLLSFLWSRLHFISLRVKKSFLDTIWVKPTIYILKHLFSFDFAKLLLTVDTNQAWSSRVDMQKKFFGVFLKPITCLEIGIWFGKGSTSILMNHLPIGSTLISVDKWDLYLTTEDKKTSEMERLSRLAAHSALNVFLDNKEESRRVESIMAKADSIKLMTLLPKNSFDLVYIDGSHYYEKVLQEIEQAKRIAKEEFAIICGDDLEKLPNSERVREAKQNLNRDFYNGYHPGVLLAVYESFEEVNMVNGFWWIYRIKGRFSASVVSNNSATTFTFNLSTKS